MRRSPERVFAKLRFVLDEARRSPGRKRPSIVVARRMWPGARHALSEAGIGWVVGSTDKESIRWLNLTLESAILRH
jgi:hypothetical protein